MYILWSKVLLNEYKMSYCFQQYEYYIGVGEGGLFDGTKYGEQLP